MAVVYDQKADHKMYDVFSVRTEDTTDYAYTCTPKHWLDKNKREAFFAQYGSSIKAPSTDVIVSFWANRYSRYIAFVHWALAKGYDIDTSLNGINVFLLQKPGIGELIYEFSLHSFSGKEHSYSREERQKKLSHFYREHVSWLFHTLADVAGLRSKDMWGQLYHAVPYFIGLAEVTETDNIRASMDEDWEFITKKAHSELFLEKRNPFSFRCVEIPNPADDNPLYTKPTCCLAYKASETYCYRCPRMKPDMRNEYYTKLKEKKS